MIAIPMRLRPLTSLRLNVSASASASVRLRMFDAGGTLGGVRTSPYQFRCQPFAAPLGARRSNPSNVTPTS